MDKEVVRKLLQSKECELCAVIQHFLPLLAASQGIQLLQLTNTMNNANVGS